MRARHLEHGDTGGTRAYIPPRLSEVWYQSATSWFPPLSALASPSRSHVCELTGNSWVNSHTPTPTPTPVTRAQATQSAGSFSRCIDDPKLSRKSRCGVRPSPQSCVTHRISPLPLKGRLVVSCSDSSDVYYRAWLASRPGEKDFPGTSGPIRVAVLIWMNCSSLEKAKYEHIWVQFLFPCVINLSVASRTTPDSAGPVSNKNPPLHRPAELKVPGGSTYRKGFDRLFKTQVWPFVSPNNGRRGQSPKTLFRRDYAIT